MGARKEDKLMISLPPTVKEVMGQGRLPAYAIENDFGTALVYKQGAHVAEWAPTGQRPVLWMSAESPFVEGTPFRCGMPICGPWFGKGADGKQDPLHGFFRILPWQLLLAKQTDAGITILDFGLVSTNQTMAWWPYRFELKYRVAVGPEFLYLSLQVTNTGTKTFTFEEMLHTYLAVSDVRMVKMVGLSGYDYIDKAGGKKENRKQGESFIIFGDEVDRVYEGHQCDCMVVDPTFRREITVTKRANTTVIWNPGPVRACAIPYFGNDEWPNMVCVERGNAGDDAQTWRPSESTTMFVKITSQMTTE